MTKNEKTKNSREAAKNESESYDEHSVRVLKGLDPIKHLPAMYTDIHDPTHIIREVIDNAADEALGGFAKNIYVKVFKDGSVFVEDDGRGIPIGWMKEEKASAAEVIFTRLHSGGKFDKANNGAYAFSGGLHGVGVCVTNALSDRLEVRIRKNGEIHEIVFSGGNVSKKLANLGKVEDLPPEILAVSPRGETGTYVRAWPTPSVFEVPHVHIGEMEQNLRAKSVLMPWVSTTIEVEGAEPKTWHYPSGLRQYIDEIAKPEEGWLAEPFEVNASVDADLAASTQGKEDSSNELYEGEGVHCVFAWSPAGGTFRESFTNLIPTKDGGRHVTGLRNSVFEAVKSFIEHRDMLPRGIKLDNDDVWGRVSFVISTKMLSPVFQNQTKDSLLNKSAIKLVLSLVKDRFEIWLNEHPEEGKKIAEAAVEQAVARSKVGQKTERKKMSGGAVLPGKLSDCELSDVSKTEVYLVEGDSAGGSTKQGRDKSYQAVFPMRGKVLNTWTAKVDKLHANFVISDISVATGLDPNNPSDLTKLRYGKIIIMSDADVDGRHIQVLLFTLFLKHFPEVIRKGHLYVAQTPLFRIDAPQKGRKGGHRKFYALDEAELEDVMKRLKKENIRQDDIGVTRFKGLGEMNAEQLRESAMNPDTRRLLRVNVRDAERAAELFDMMMNEKNAAKRREWMERRGHEVEGDE